MAVRIGLVGLGGMGGHHLKGYGSIPAARVAALCDVDRKRLHQRQAIQINLDKASPGAVSAAGATTYTDFALMLREADLDAVDICTPTYLHAAMALTALKAGKHVFCEKPLALTARDARRVAAAAKKAGRFVMVGHVLRFWPEYLWMKEALDSRRFGRLRSAKFWRWGAMPRWGYKGWFGRARQSGQAALDLHIHDVDTIQWFLGRPTRVQSAGRLAKDGGVDYIWTTYECPPSRCQCPGGAIVTSEGGWQMGDFPFAMGATLVFEKASLDYNSSRQDTLVAYPREGKPQTVRVPQAEGYREELAYFVQCVATGRAPKLATAADAASAVAIVEAEARSVRTGKAVAVRGN